MYLIIVCLINSITTTIVISFLALPLKSRQNRKRLVLFLLLSTFLFSILKPYVEDKGAVMIFFAPTIFLSLAVGVKIIMKASAYQTLTVCGLYFLISIAGDTIALFIIREGMGVTILYLEETSPGLFIALCLTSMIQITLACLCSWKMMRHWDGTARRTDDRERLTGMVIVTQFAVFFVIWVLRKEILDFEKIKFILFSAQLLFSLVAVYLFLTSRRDKMIGEMQRALETAEQRNEAFYRYYQEQEYNERCLRQLNHDFNNLMTAALGMAEKGEYERAVELFESMEQYCRSESAGE